MSSSPTAARNAPILAIQLSRDHVHGPEGGDHVGHHVPFQHLVQAGHGEEARRAAAHPVGAVTAVADHVEAELAVGAFDREVRLAAGGPDAVTVHDDLEVVHQAFDV